MKRSSILEVTAIACCALLATAAFGGQGREISIAPRPMVPGPIENRVLDLLDEEILLVGGNPDSVWESERFSTARMNRIGLRASAADGSLPAQCRICWQYTADDVCLDSVPLVYAPYPPPVVPDFGDDPGLPRPTGSPAISTDFSVVRGLYARVRCTMPEIVFIGDDPDAPDEVTSTLTDVKVLLRRE